MVCQVCHDLNKSSSEEGVHDWEYLSVTTVAASADGGCPGCQLLFNAGRVIAPCWDPLLSYADAAQYGRMGHQNLIVSWVDRLRIARSRFEVFHPFVTQPTPWSSIPVYTITSPKPPTLDSSIPLIRTWFATCQATHEECKTASDALLPTRIIDVGSATAEPRLYTSHPNERASYCALSHCWGAPDPAVPRVVTTRANIAKHHQQMPLQDLPKTFREAVCVVRQLGIRFLWIDSLCIMQGDANDWAHEAAKMADVYSNATLTLAADWAPNSAGGLFSEHTWFPPEDERNRSFNQKDKTGNSHQIHVVYRGTTDHGAKRFHPCMQWANKCKLLERAWCFQERALSSRIIYFGNAELLWECKSILGSNCGCDYDKWRMDSFYDSAGGPRMLSELTRCRKYGIEYPEGLSYNWRKTVEAYTLRNATYATDRLHAISGLARRYAVPESAYIAGIWRTKQMYDYLLWRNLPEQDERAGGFERLPPDYAPSWSWASVVAPVGFDNYVLSEYTRSWEIIDVSYTLKTSDPFGPVSSAALTLRCHIFPIISLHDRNVLMTGPGGWEYYFCFYWDAGTGAKEWCEEGFEYALVVAYTAGSYSTRFISGIMVRRRLDRSLGDMVGGGRWQRIGYYEQIREGGDRRRAWLAEHEKVAVVLE